jgi:hypothetical protein
LKSSTTRLNSTTLINAYSWSSATLRELRGTWRQQGGSREEDTPAAAAAAADTSSSHQGDGCNARHLSYKRAAHTNVVRVWWLHLPRNPQLPRPPPADVIAAVSWTAPCCQHLASRYQLVGLQAHGLKSNMSVEERREHSVQTFELRGIKHHCWLKALFC